jgi:hypothetical protein
MKTSILTEAAVRVRRAAAGFDPVGDSGDGGFHLAQFAARSINFELGEGHSPASNKHNVLATVPGMLENFVSLCYSV